MAAKTLDQMAAEWNDAAATWDDAGTGPREYASTLYPAYWTALGMEPGSAEAQELKVCDFGCGTGILTESLQRDCGTVVCVDIADKMVARVLAKKAERQWGNVTAVCGVMSPEFLAAQQEQQGVGGEAAAGAFAPGSFDVIFCSSVLTFIPGLERTLHTLATLLKPGTGRLVHSDWMPGAFDDEERGEGGGEPAAAAAEEGEDRGVSAKNKGGGGDSDTGGGGGGDGAETAPSAAAEAADWAASSSDGAVEPAAAAATADGECGGTATNASGGSNEAGAAEAAAVLELSAPVGAFDDDVANDVYARSGLRPVALSQTEVTMFGRTANVFVGVAARADGGAAAE